MPGESVPFIASRREIGAPSTDPWPAPSIDEMRAAIREGLVKELGSKWAALAMGDEWPPRINIDVVRAALLDRKPR